MGLGNEDLTIDPHNLDLELMNQPVLFKRVCDEIEGCIRSRDAAKIDYEKLEAELFNKVRSDPAEYGLDKPTEKAVNCVVSTNEGILRSKRFLDLCNLHLDTAKNDLRAVEMKKKALENLVELFRAQYFSVPNEGRELPGGKYLSEAAQEKVVEQHREKLREAKADRKSRNKEEKIGSMSPKAKEGYEEAEKISPDAEREVPAGRAPRARRRRVRD